jgi:hypothetical protein
MELSNIHWWKPQNGLKMEVIQMTTNMNHSYDILGAGMLWKPKDLHKIR